MASRIFRFSLIVFLVLLSGSSLCVNADDSEGITSVKGCPFTSIYNFGTLSKNTGTHGNSEVIDYISSAFHLPSPKPYPVNKEDGKFPYGADFAVEGATALEWTFTNSSISKQVDKFMTHLSSICSNDHECKEKLRHALFLVAEFGSRDYYPLPLEGIHNMEVLDTLVPKVVESIRDSVIRLIHAGAKNIMVHGTLPFGCQPSYLQEFGSKDPMSKDHSYKCLNKFNLLSRNHNSHLHRALVELRSQHPDVQIVFADYFNAYIALLKSLRKTCGSSKGGDASAICSDPKIYIHLDENHLTQEANKFMAEAIITGGFVYPKLNLPDRFHCVM